MSFPYRKPLPSARARLVCFPFAGGAALAYREWTAALAPAGIDVCAIELPGRGARTREAPIADPDTLAAHLAALVAPLCDRPVALFGHSLGARLAYAVARRVPDVIGLVASASPAPHTPPLRVRSHLDRTALLAELRRLGGTPDAILDDAELVDLFLPALRADFAVLERGIVPSPPPRLACPVVALASLGDREVSFSAAGAWEACTTAAFRFVEVTGDHFFLHAQRDLVHAEVHAALARWL